jgi:hypothetical protein
MNATMRLRFQIRRSDAQTEATTWSLTDTEHVTIQLQSEMYGITWNEQKRFNTEFSILMIEFEAGKESIRT